MKRLLLYLFLGIGMSLGSFAQGIQLSGTVTDFNNQPIDNFLVYYFAFDTAAGNVDSGVAVTAPNGNYSAFLAVGPTPSTHVDLYWQDCNTAQSANFLGQASIVQNIQTCASSCNAAFSYSPTALNPQIFSFWANQPGLGTYTWVFGDGTAGSGPQANHTYNIMGPVTVCLYFDDGAGCTDTVCQTILIGGQSGNCDATFTMSQIPGNNTVSLSPVNFDPTLMYEWTLGDGSLSNSPTYTHTYSQSGVYNICLLAYDSSFSCIDTSCQVIVISGTGGGNCNASFSATPLGTLMAFNADFFDPMLHYQWDFGDGTVGYSSSAVHQYAQTDTFQVCLIVTDSINGSCADTVCQWIFAPGGQGGNCDATFGSYPDSSGQNPFTFNFYPFQPTPGLNYSWDFGDGGSSSQAYPTHNYNAPGIYTVCLAIDDGAGCVDTSCLLLTVTQGGTGGCDANFFASSPQMSPIGGAFVIFTANSPSQASYQWDFGDGSTGIGHSTNHLYTTPGTYTACLIVTGFNGCSDTSCQSIIVPPFSVPCNASFSSMVAPNNQVNFAADYSGYTSYIWYLGDGNTATGENVSHTYAAAGTYTICLTVMDSASNCVDSLCQAVQTSQIQPPPGFAVLGQVWAGNQVADDFTAWLIVFDSAAGTLAAVDTFVSDSSNFGFFFFVAPNGDYRVKASLNAASTQYASYMPTYYGDELFWNNATVVNQNTYPFVQINLIAGNNPGGPGFVGGLVSQGANKAEGDPLAGMHVLVTNDQGDAVMHTTTNEDGEYELDNLAYGTFHVWIEIWGRNLEHHTITIAPGAETHTNVDFEVTDEDVTATGTTGIEDLLDSGSLQIFPNPISGEQDLNLRLSLNQSTEVNFSLQNMVGQTVIKQSERMIAGPQAKTIQVSSLPAGVYLLRIKVNGESMSPIKVVIQ